MLIVSRDTTTQAANAPGTQVDFAWRASEDCAACARRREEGLR
jgi:hypothetical protein